MFTFGTAASSPGRDTAAPSHLVHPKYRPDIDGLRAVAVLAVVAFHAFPGLAHGGYIGVDIFFVISGFLITTIVRGSLEDGTFSFAAFYVRRVKRIFPALIGVLLACAGIGWFALLPGEYENLGRHIAGGAAFVSNFVLWRESGYFDAAAASKLLLHLWSLGIEEQFYVVWPAALFLAWKWRLNLVAVTFFILLASFVANVVWIRGDAIAAFYSPFTRLWELMIGGVLAFDRRAAGRWPNLKAFSGFALILLALLTLTKDSPFPGWWALLPTVGTALVISAGPAAWLNRRVLSRRPLVWIGLISYPLYLWHWPLISFAAMQGWVSRETRLALIAAAIVLAWLTYRLIERPVRPSPGRTWLPLAATMVCAAAIGFAIDASRGFPQRVPAEIQALASYRYEHEGPYRRGRCFLESSQTHKAFAPDCTAGAGVLLWGDSHAAHLQPGLLALKEKEGFAFGALTASACPPVLGLRVALRPHCAAINDYVLSVVRDRKPSTVILAANWLHYDGREGYPRLDPDALGKTVETLLAAGIPHVVVFGQVPMWETDQPKVGIKAWQATGAVPQRSALALRRDAFEINARLRKALAKTGALFVSPTDLLCNPEGCLIAADPAGAIPMAWDVGHLTTEGSIRLIEAARRSLPARLGP